jgi:hypothetical protein
LWRKKAPIAINKGEKHNKGEKRKDEKGAQKKGHIKLPRKNTRERVFAIPELSGRRLVAPPLRITAHPGILGPKKPTPYT